MREVKCPLKDCINIKGNYCKKNNIELEVKDVDYEGEQVLICKEYWN